MLCSLTIFCSEFSNALKSTTERKVYIKKNPTNSQITIIDIQERIVLEDNHITDKIMQFEKGLHKSRQF